MLRSTLLGAAAGFVIAALLVGPIIASQGADAEWALPVLVLGVPLVLVGALAGLGFGARRLPKTPRGLIRTLVGGTILVILALVAVATGLL
jgi:uncharacterized membrane protein AbrB (regulator of aidB expression)